MINLILGLALCLTSPESADTDSRLRSALESLSPPQSEYVLAFPFREDRHFPFRRYPKTFEGTAYLAPDGQLAVVYHFPSAYTLLFESDHVVLIRGDSGPRVIEAEAGLQLFRHLLRWDTDAVLRDWHLVNSQSDDDVSILYLKPANDSTGDAVREMVIRLDDERVISLRIEHRQGLSRNYHFESASQAGPLPEAVSRHFENTSPEMP